MSWDWGYIGTVVPDVQAAVEFFTGPLGLPLLGEGEFTAIAARGVVLGLGGNCLLAVTTPTGPHGRAAEQLSRHRGGLCHLAIAAHEPGGNAAGARSTSPVGEGALMPRELAAGLSVEVLYDRALRPDTGSGGPVRELDHVAAVVGDLTEGVQALAEFSLAHDPVSSGWTFPALQTVNAVLPASWGYLELNQAGTSDGPFGSIWARQGPAIVGLTLTVVDVAATVSLLRRDDVSVTDPTPVTAQRRPGEAEVSLGDAAVISMGSAHGTRLFLFQPSPEAPSYRT
jgi:catechol 2,3-dioxygenase-like lactoylglutathione lyase family enzyme